MRHPYFKRLVATKEKDVIEAESHVRLSLENTNRLLWVVPGADGVKTGTTQAAGQCLVASATRDGMRLLVVVLDSLDRWHDAAALLEYGFGSFRYIRACACRRGATHSACGRFNGKACAHRLRYRPKRVYTQACVWPQDRSGFAR